MDTPRPSDDNNIIADSEHVIMSEGLDLDLGGALSIDQILEINGVRLVCSVLRVKSMILDESIWSIWEFELEVPGLSFSDLLDAKNIVLHYDNASFRSTSTVELKTQHIVESPVLIFIAKRIINDYE
jgi:hypothetical protein